MGRSRKQRPTESPEEVLFRIEQLSAKGDFVRAAEMCIQVHDEMLMQEKSDAKEDGDRKGQIPSLEWLERAEGLYLSGEKRLEAALVRRKMGEARIELQQWTMAENDLKVYLTTAKELRDDHERQRALTTLGRFYLEQSRSTLSETSRVDSLQRADKYCREALVAEQKILSCSREERVKMRLGVLRNHFLVKQELIDAHRSSKDNRNERCRYLINDTLEVLEKYSKLAFNEGFKEDKFDVLLQKGVFLSKVVNKHEEAIENLDKAVSLWANFKNRIGQKEAKGKLRDGLIELTAALVRAKNFRRAYDAHLAILKHCTPIINKNARRDRPVDNNEEDGNCVDNLNSLHCLRRIAEATESLTSNTLASKKEQAKCFELIADMLTDLQSFPAQALEYYQRAFDLALEINQENNDDFVDEKPLLESMASSATDMSDYDLAFSHYMSLVRGLRGNNVKIHRVFKLMLECIDKMDGSSKKDELREEIGRWAKDVFVDDHERDKRFHELAIQLQIAAHLEPAVKETMEDKIKTSGSKCGVDIAELKFFMDEIDAINDEQGSSEGNGGPEGDAYPGNDAVDHLGYFYPDQMANLIRENDDNLCSGNRRLPFKPSKNGKGETKLHTKCQKPGNEREVLSLIAQGYNVNDRDHAGFTPLQEAAIHGHISYIKILMENGAKVDAATEAGETALIDAAANGYFDIALYLLDKGAKPELQDIDGWTALSHLENYKNHLEKENTPMSKEEMAKCDELEARVRVHFEKLKKSGQTVFTREKKEKSTIHVVDFSPDQEDDFLIDDCRPKRRPSHVLSEHKKRRRTDPKKEHLSSSSSISLKRDRNDDWIENTIANLEQGRVSDDDEDTHQRITSTSRTEDDVNSENEERRRAPSTTSSPLSTSNALSTTSVPDDVSGSVAALTQPPTSLGSSSARLTDSVVASRVSQGRSSMSFRVKARVEERVFVIPVSTPESQTIASLAIIINERFVASERREKLSSMLVSRRRQPLRLRLHYSGAELDDNDCVGSVLSDNDEVEAVVVEWLDVSPKQMYEEACSKGVWREDRNVQYVPEMITILHALDNRKEDVGRIDLSCLQLNKIRLMPAVTVVLVCYDHLTELDLSRNLIDEQALKTLFQDCLFQLKRLQHLDLSFNLLSTIEPISNVIDDQWRLRSLLLDFNFLDNKSSQSVLQLLRRCPLLDQLGLRGNPITKDFFRPIDTWLSVLRSRPTFKMRGNEEVKRAENLPNLAVPVGHR